MSIITQKKLEVANATIILLKCLFILLECVERWQKLFSTYIVSFFWVNEAIYLPNTRLALPPTLDEFLQLTLGSLAEGSLYLKSGLHFQRMRIRYLDP